eukprot:SAG22_NODE_43_length_25304_cov_5.394644_16_plen_335_part_00
MLARIEVAGAELFVTPAEQVWAAATMIRPGGQKVLVARQMLMLSEFAGDGNTSPLHPIVENCDASVFESSLLQLLVQFKWEENVYPMLRRQMIMHSVSVVLVASAVLISSQNGTIDDGLGGSTSDESDGLALLASVVDILMALVGLTELLALASEARQLVRKGLVLYFRNPWNVLDTVAGTSLLATAAAYFFSALAVVQTAGAFGVAVRVIKTLDYLRAFPSTGPLVRMLIVITVGIIPFLSVLVIAISAATLFFMINMPGSPAFTDDPRAGVLWPFFTVFRAVLGDFDIDEYTNKAAAAMFYVFSLFVMVLMLNLLIAIMGDSCKLSCTGQPL